MSREDACHNCHAEPRPDFRSTCARCALERRDKERRMRAHRRRERLCVTCGAAAEPGRSYCAKHLVAFVRYNAGYRARRA